MDDQDWVECFDKAVEHAFVYGTGFIRITTNGPGGMQLSVVDPKDYRYLEPIEAEPTEKPKVQESNLTHGGLWIEALFKHQREGKE